MAQLKKPKYWKVYLTVFLYVAIGTIALLASYPSDPFYCGEWMIYVFLITFPAHIFSFPYRYFESGNLHVVLIIQAVVLILWLGIAHIICMCYDKSKRRRK